MDEEIDVFCEHLTCVAAEMLSGGPLTALVQADDDGRIRLIILVPEEFSVTLYLKTQSALVTMVEALDKVQDFALNHFRGNLFTETSWEKFTSLPGRFEFLCDDAPQLCCRLAQWRVTERFGHRFFKGVDIYDDAVQIHMLGGNYLVNIVGFQDSLEKQMGYMATLLRKPIRKRYDRKAKK